MAHLLGRLREVQGVRGCTSEHVTVEVTHQLDLALCLSAPDGDDRRTELLAAVVESKPAGEQPVAVGVLDSITGLGTAGSQRAGHDLAPDIEVVVGVGDDLWFACRPRRGVYPRYVPVVDRKETVGVLRTEVLLCGER
ncbi:MAG: hypothetical protein J07HX64_02797 [halophilic archaeon J07HX64]|nr:MAG: hypothetical protein J07HX64_02797 [halophilic archaeon J07HX64]